MVRTQQRRSCCASKVARHRQDSGRGKPCGRKASCTWSSCWSHNRSINSHGISTPSTILSYSENFRMCSSRAEHVTVVMVVEVERTDGIAS